ASGARRTEPGLDETSTARSIEGVVDTDSVGQPVAFGDHIGLGRIDGIGRAEVPCRGAALAVGVGDHNARRARDTRTLYHRDTDAAEAHDENGRAFDDLCGVDDRAYAGLQRASDNGGEI